jgi:hypothetical protein
MSPALRIAPFPRQFRYFWPGKRIADNTMPAVVYMMKLIVTQHCRRLISAPNQQDSSIRFKPRFFSENWRKRILFVCLKTTFRGSL